MKVLNNEEFGDIVMKYANPEKPFKPMAYYDRDGDCIEFFIKPDNFYAERIDDLVTVYYSQETNEVVGSLIKGVKDFIKNILDLLPGFKIEIQDGKVHLVHIFQASLWKQKEENEILVRTYQKLIKEAQDAKIETEVTI